MLKPHIYLEGETQKEGAPHPSTQIVPVWLRIWALMSSKGRANMDTLIPTVLQIYGNPNL